MEPEPNQPESDSTGSPVDILPYRPPEQIEPAELCEWFRRVRAGTEALASDLEPEDQNLQSMPEASPVKWHRAHTSWFFETFVLERMDPQHRPFHPAFRELFNSYYNGVGRQFPRPRRSLISRPGAAEVRRYREFVDDAVCRLIERLRGAEWNEAARLIVLGLNHEQQHQELILTDLKHALSFNSLAPAVGAPPALRPRVRTAGKDQWIERPAAEVEIGHAGAGFCFDNETPRHRVLLNCPFALARQPVTCGEFLEFMADGGYEEPALWLSDGWAWLQESGVRAPLYWDQSDDGWTLHTLAGRRPVSPDEPLCHVSFYEAQAYAQWRGCRLPTEAEWESAAGELEIEGHFADSGRFHPEPAAGDGGLVQIYGSVWEWTSSPYTAYPGFRPADGVLGEYNGKFMANQLVLRGGSCATPAGHIRPSYRNFFYPVDRWQFSGIRLARDLGRP